MRNFGRRLAKEHFCEIISKSVHWFSRGSCLQLFSIYSPGGHFVQQSKTVRASLVSSHLRNILVYFFKLDELVKEEKSFEGFSIFRLYSIFLFLALVAILFNRAK